MLISLIAIFTFHITKYHLNILPSIPAATRGKLSSSNYGRSFSFPCFVCSVTTPSAVYPLYL